MRQEPSHDSEPPQKSVCSTFPKLPPIRQKKTHHLGLKQNTVKSKENTVKSKENTPFRFLKQNTVKLDMFEEIGDFKAMEWMLLSYEVSMLLPT